jgi:hypothetical protein
MVKKLKDANVMDRGISGQLHQDRRAEKKQPKVKRDMELTLHSQTSDEPAPKHNDMVRHAPSDRKPHEHFEHVEDMRHRVPAMKVSDYSLDHSTVKTQQRKGTDQLGGLGISHSQDPKGDALLATGFDKRPRRHVHTQEHNEMISAGGVVDHVNKLPTYNSPGVR